MTTPDGRGPSVATPIERERATVLKWAGGKRPARLGCSYVSHDRLGVCAACSAYDPAELLLWRLDALEHAANSAQAGEPS